MTETRRRIVALMLPEEVRMLQASIFQWRVGLLVLVAILAMVIALTVAGKWPLYGEEEKVLWGYVEAAEPVQVLA